MMANGKGHGGIQAAIVVAFCTVMWKYGYSREVVRIAVRGAIAALSGERAEREPWGEFRQNCHCKEVGRCWHVGVPKQAMVCSISHSRPDLCPRLHHGMTWDTEAQRWVSVSR